MWSGGRPGATRLPDGRMVGRSLDSRPCERGVEETVAWVDAQLVAPRAAQRMDSRILGPVEPNLNTAPPALGVDSPVEGAPVRPLATKPRAAEVAAPLAVPTVYDLLMGLTGHVLTSSVSASNYSRTLYGLDQALVYYYFPFARLSTIGNAKGRPV